MVIENVVTENVRNLRVMVNGTLYYTEKNFKLKDNDEVRVQIKPIVYDKECKVKFVGYEENVFYDSSETPEKVFDEPITSEEVRGLRLEDTLERLRRRDQPEESRLAAVRW